MINGDFIGTILEKVYEMISADQDITSVNWETSAGASHSHIIIEDEGTEYILEVNLL